MRNKYHCGGCAFKCEITTGVTDAANVSLLNFVAFPLCPTPEKAHWVALSPLSAVVPEKCVDCGAKGECYHPKAPKALAAECAARGYDWKEPLEPKGK